MSGEPQAVNALRDAIDALAAAIHHADAGEIERSAADAGVDLGAEASAMRARFLARVAVARGGGGSIATDAGAAGAAPSRRIEIPVSPRLQPVPTKIGRYSILRRIGFGGMGIVYAAYDEDLDRKIAIKVVASHRGVDDRRKDRLRREAQAMARVSHPNLVNVHEVGVTEAQIFIAMEFVAGPTMQAWLEQGARPWREVVAVFQQAGRGLQALHDAGLVHRDFKPANVILGDDGRVRVLDLGLVGADRAEDPLTPAERLSSSATSKLRASLTITGERVGTPAYMSREQFLGVELTPASDIYSFCIALFEALHGVHPFGTDTLADLQAAVISHRIRAAPDPSRTPGWLHALVLRGLSPDPRERFPSMQALVDALGRDPARVHRRWFGGALILAATITAGVAASLTTQGAGAIQVCAGAEAEIESTWSKGQHEKIAAAITATDRPYADEVAGRVLLDLDAYARAWVVAHRSACLAHAGGEHSAAVLDQRMTCLGARRQALAETVSILANADGDVVDHADQLVSRLPSLGRCADLSALAAERKGSDDPTIQRATRALRGSLVRADALANAGRITDAAALAAKVAAEAEALGDPALHADALLAGARATINLGDQREASEALLDRALVIAVAERLDHEAAEAMARLLYVRGLRAGSAAQAIAEIPLTSAMVDRVGDDPALRSLLLNVIGAVHMAQGEPGPARVAFAEALRLSERELGLDHIDLAFILGNLAIVTDDDEVRAGIFARMRSILERRLSAAHPQTLDAAMLAAIYTADPARAAEILASTCRALEDRAQSRELLGACLVELGKVADERDLEGEAAVHFARALEVLAGEEAPLPAARRAFLRAHVDFARGELEPAKAEIDGFLGARRDEAEGGSWWALAEVAEVRILGARVDLVGERPEEAIAALRTALAELAAIETSAPAIEHRRLVASARWTLARALVARGGADAIAEARTLLGEASSLYRRSETGYRRRLDAVQALLGALAAPPVNK